MVRISDAVKHIIIINVLFFVATATMGDKMYDLFSLWFPENEHFKFWQVVSHMFMHGGVMHIAFNMLGLWMFASPLEQMWGKKKFLFFYFSAGLGAALIHTAVNYYYFNEGLTALVNAGVNEADIMNLLSQGQYNKGWATIMSQKALDNFLSAYISPAVGASGALYGVLVAFGMLFPNAELMLIFLPIPIKAKYFIPLLLLYDFVSGITGGGGIFGGGIAHFAHLGGALFGFIMMWYWKKNQFNNNRWN
jgi:membrane associated rhomboid family serine protease